MGSDLFGSFAEASCAALVIASISSFGIDHLDCVVPCLLVLVGILVCLITTLFATDFFEIMTVKEIEPALKRQVIISTALMIVGMSVVSWICPALFLYNLQLWYSESSQESMCVLMVGLDAFSDVQAQAW